ncbi:MAG TPA: hypothetical protein VLV31_05295 [Candidatus Acidoferrales bacterium]|nr:hypothetical protein [Candidatus Acidoferrales bacterium]
MSADDRFEEIKRLLDSTINEFQTLFESAGGFEDSRVGNGWQPEKILPEIYYVQPRPLPELMRVAESRKRSLFKNRVLSFLKPKEQDIRTSDRPRLRLIPFWRIRGYHECFYFRGNEYKIDLPEDVIAVEVEGKIRDLVGVGSEGLNITNLAKRLLGRKDPSNIKSFSLSEVTELAYMYDESSLFVNAQGREDLEAEAFFDRTLPLRKTSVEELNLKYPEVEFSPASITKDDLVRRLHASIVKPPTTFSKILSNRFQITQLAEYLMPVYSFTFEWRGQRKSVSVHGYTGNIF